MTYNPQPSQAAITASLDMAKKLRDAKFSSECEFVHYGELMHKSQLPKGPQALMHIPYKMPTAEEILLELPKKIEGRRLEMFLEDKYWLVYRVDHTKFSKIGFGADTLANAAAQMYIYLYNNSLLNDE